MLNIRISQYAINTVDNCRLIKVKYKQPEGGIFHPFDTRAEECNYISESGFSFLGNLDNLTRPECIAGIEKQLGENRRVRHIYQRILIVKNGIIVWENKNSHSHEKDFFKGFVVHALYGEYIPNEHKYGYNITESDMSGEEIYVWETCDYALGRAINFSRKNPDNYCLLSGINFDYNEAIRGSAAPPWCISQLSTPILKGLILNKGDKVIYNTDVFFGFFKSLTNQEKSDFTKKFPETEKWINWYATDGCHKNIDITEQYNLYVRKLKEKRNVVVSVSNTLSADHNPDNPPIIDEAQYQKARNMFFSYNGSLADMCADGSISNYMLYHVPKALEKKWTDELCMIWLDDIENTQNISQSVVETVNLIHRDRNLPLIRKFADALDKSYFLIDSYSLLTVMQIIMKKIQPDLFGESEEFRYLMDRMEIFARESLERKMFACECDISETEMGERFSEMLANIREWKKNNQPAVKEEKNEENSNSDENITESENDD